MQMRTVIRQAILITHQEISKAILNNVVSTLITKDLKSPFVIDSPNAPKNNDGDASASCKFRGNN